MTGQLHSDIVGIPKGFGRSLKTYGHAQRGYRWYAAQWANDNLRTNYGKNSKPRGVPLKYIPPPYNQYPKHKKHKFNWMAFDSDNKLLPEFEEVIDWPEVARKTIEQPMSSITESLGMKMKDVVDGVVKQSVRSGF